MYNVGTFDLYEGLQQAAQLFVDYSISRYNRVITLHTVGRGGNTAPEFVLDLIHDACEVRCLLHACAREQRVNAVNA